MLLHFMPFLQSTLNIFYWQLLRFHWCHWCCGNYPCASDLESRPELTRPRTILSRPRQGQRLSCQGQGQCESQGLGLQGQGHGHPQYPPICGLIGINKILSTSVLNSIHYISLIGNVILYLYSIIGHGNELQLTPPAK